MPGDPARTGRVAFWQPDVSPPPLLAAGSAEDLTVVLPGGDGVECVWVPAVLLPVRAALPVLTRARTDLHGHRESVFWGTAGVLALQFVARGLLPGLSAQDHNAWRVVPLPLEDIERVRRLAAAMPPEAHAVPRDGAGPQAQAHAVAADAAGPPRLADPERLLCASPDPQPHRPRGNRPLGRRAGNRPGHLGRTVVPVRRRAPRLQLAFRAGRRAVHVRGAGPARRGQPPVVRLRDQRVLIDPQEVHRARAQQDRKITPIDALSAALKGSTEVDGGRIDVHATGWPAALRERRAAPESLEPVAQPAALAATLRDYQRRGLSLLARMTSPGAGCCLADDMGLGKTITLISMVIFPVRSAC